MMKTRMTQKSAHMLKSGLILCWLILFTLLSGCATHPAPVVFEPMIRLAPDTFGQPISIYQQIQAERDGKKRDMNVVLEITPEKLTLVGIAMERRMMTVTFDGKDLAIWKDTKLPEQVSPEIVLSNLQLAIWPKEAIATALPTGWTISEEGQTRVICHNNDRMILIEYSQPERWLGTIKMTDFRYRYALTIQSVPLP